MTVRRLMFGAAAIALAGACSRPPQPLSDAEKAALADSVGKVATEMFASVSRNPSADNVLSYYARGTDLVIVEAGSIFPTYDSIVKDMRATYRPGMKVTAELALQRAVVLDRDVVVLAGLLSGSMQDSTGPAMAFRGFAWTAVYHRTADGWKIAAETSAPPPPAPAPPTPARR